MTAVMPEVYTLNVSVLTIPFPTAHIEQSFWAHNRINFLLADQYKLKEISSSFVNLR
jgi:hypothetical protein